MVKKQANKKSELLRIAEYLVSGGAYFWSGYLVFFICDQLIGLNLFWAKLLANIIGWTVNYLLQRYWVFNNKKLSKYKTKVTGRYIFITLVNFGLDYLIVNFLKNNGLTPYVGQFVASGLFTVWNYFWYKLWVFPENASKLNKKKRKKNK
jgi:putative flippase GtrA